MRKLLLLMVLAGSCHLAMASGIYNPGSTGGGGGSPGGSNYNVQVASAGAFSGSSFFNVYGSSSAHSGIFDMVTHNINNLSEASSVTQAVNFQQTQWISGPSNALINGGMEFYQRGPSKTITTGSNGTYTFDRWKIADAQGASFTCIVASSTAHVDTGLTSAHISCSAVGASSPGFGLSQPVENYYDYAGSSVTFSVRYYQDASGGAPQISIVDSNGTTTGVGTTGTGSWLTMSATRYVSAGITSLSFELFTFAGTGSLIYYDSAMAVRGDQIVPFFSRPIPQEFLMCQRYYETNYINAPGNTTDPGGYWPATVINTTRSRGGIFFQTRKRAAPTIVVYSDSTGSSGVMNWHNTTIGNGDINTSSLIISVMGFAFEETTTGSESAASGYFTADAEM